MYPGIISSTYCETCEIKTEPKFKPCLGHESPLGRHPKLPFSPLCLGIRPIAPTRFQSSKLTVFFNTKLLRPSICSESLETFHCNSRKPKSHSVHLDQSWSMRSDNAERFGPPSTSKLRPVAVVAFRTSDRNSDTCSSSSSFKPCKQLSQYFTNFSKCSFLLLCSISSPSNLCSMEGSAVSDSLETWSWLMDEMFVIFVLGRYRVVNIHVAKFIAGNILETNLKIESILNPSETM